MKLVAIISIALALAGSFAAAAADKYGITPEEHAACDADAVNLCASTYPDEDMLLACMKAKRHQLSQTCLVTFIAGLKKRHLPL